MNWFRSKKPSNESSLIKYAKNPELYHEYAKYYYLFDRNIQRCHTNLYILTYIFSRVCTYFVIVL